MGTCRTAPLHVCDLGRVGTGVEVVMAAAAVVVKGAGRGGMVSQIMKAISLEPRAECGHRRSISTRFVAGSAA